LRINSAIWLFCYATAPSLLSTKYSAISPAAYQGRTYRIDRHPVMSRHPVTRMDEADLAAHLGRHTDKPMRLIDRVALRGPGVDAAAASGTPSQPCCHCR
jgi:uncharacterized protein YgbK (DUF1537 family)